jgi:hypothetical protein
MIVGPGHFSMSDWGGRAVNRCYGGSSEGQGRKRIGACGCPEVASFIVAKG